MSVAVNLNKRLAGLSGAVVVDINEYDDAVHEYLQLHGAKNFLEITDIGHVNYHFHQLYFEGCKPMRFHSLGTTPSARLFFPNKDEALLFSIAFGEKIVGSHVKEIQAIINQVRQNQ